ncbi:MAG: HEAT repeat domain-containing protein [Acidobacteriia bacterium]|nr:HEAT repeat domain-containing protein [Terriglobia bacterium]
MSARSDPHVPERRARLFIYLKTLCVLLSYIALTWVIHRAYMRKHVPDAELSLALSFTVQQVTAIFTLLAISFATKFVRYYRAQRAARFQPFIRERLILHLNGLDQWTEMRRMRARTPRELEDCLVQILASIHGAGRERLTEVARAFGLLRKWQKQSHTRNAKRRRKAISRLCLLGPLAQPDLLEALHDPDDLVRVEAARALAGSGDAQMLAAVFYMALDQNRLVRAILTEALRPQASELYGVAAPEALRSPDPKRVVAALEILRAWRKSAAIPQLPALLAHGDAAVRAAALHLVPQAGLTPEYEGPIWRAIEDPDAEVRAAAAEVCGKLKLASSLRLLQRALEDTAPRTVLVSAYALAELGVNGCKVLESEVLSGDPLRAAAALEALEHAKLNRAATVGM